MLDRHAATNGFRALRIDLFPHQHTALSALRDAGFQAIPSIAGMRSISVPLCQPEGELLQRMSGRVGREARRARRKGVMVSVGMEALEDFHALYQQTAAHQGFPVFPLEYFEDLWRTLGVNGRLQAFVAYLDGRPLATLLNTIVGDEMYYGWGGMSRCPEDKRLRANYLLHVSAMSWARQHGLVRYDLAGASEFKAWFAVDAIDWPAPLWKFYGPLRGMYPNVITTMESGGLLGRLSRRLGHRLGLSLRMPQ